MVKRKPDYLFLWIVILILVILGSIFYTIYFEDKDEYVPSNSLNDQGLAKDKPNYDDDNNLGRYITTNDRKSKNVNLCSDQCELTNDACVAFVKSGLEWRECGFNCNCPNILQACYDECGELFG